MILFHQVISCVFAIVGCAFFALPAGIIGSGFALQVSKKKKQKRVRKLRNPAAVLIQRFWRYGLCGHIYLVSLQLEILPKK